MLTLFALGCSTSEPEVARSGLTIVIPRDVEQLDPRHISDPYGLRISRLIYASLFTIDPDTLEAVPDLAESFSRPDALTYAVKLRKDLHFSDGTPLRARDVVATFRGVTDPILKSRFRNTYRRIKKVEALSDTVVRFVLTEPHATFLTDLEFPILRAVDALRTVDSFDVKRIIGAGPYRLQERVPGHLTLVANPHWHRGRPSHPKLHFILVKDDNTRAMRLLSGKGELALGSVPHMLLPLFESEESYEIKSAPGIATMYLGFNTEAVALSDPQTRRALAQAIDRQALIDAKYGGRARLTSSWIPQGHWAHAPKLASYTYDPELAKTLLKASAAKGTRLILRTTSNRLRISIARAIAVMLRETGIEIEVRPSETASMIAALKRGHFDLVLLEVPEVVEPHVLSWFFASNRIPGPNNEGANRWRYRNAELDKLFEQGRRSSDRAIRVATYHKIQHILARDLPVLPLWQPEMVAVVRKGVDYQISRDGRFGTLARGASR